jgi:hypothetical protein
MVVAERLKTLREAKSYRRVTSRLGPVCSVAMSRASRTDIRSHPSKLWRSSRALWKFSSIN